MERSRPGHAESEHGQVGIKTKETKNPGFKAAFKQILSRPLSPDNIDSYAEDALTDLIGLTNSVVDLYCKKQPSTFPSRKELEDAAFSHFGLTNIEKTLDHVASKAEEIKQIDKIIEGAEVVQSIVVPPDDKRPFFNYEGNGTVEEKSVISRTKTVLFILSNDFGIDISDQEQLSIKTGVLSDEMMRKLSYYLLDIPRLERTILCCDEEGNVTYIFNNAVLAKHGISSDDLTQLTKNGLNDLIGADPELGRRIVYSKNFVPKMIGLVKDLKLSNDNQEHQNTTGIGVYLYPEPPEGILSANGIANSFNVSQSVIAKAIKSIEDELGETEQYRFRFAVAPGYTTDQQEQIRKYLEERGQFLDQPPKGVLSAKRVANKLGVTERALARTVKELGQSLGETRAYKFGSQPVTGYTPEQQELIRQHLENKGVFRDVAPEGVRSITGIAADLQSTHRTIAIVIAELGDSLGEPHEYKIGTQPTVGYTPEQQALIRHHLQKKGYFIGQAPEGFLSAKGLSTSLDIVDKSIYKAIKELGEALGETHIYKFRSQIAVGYTPEQQELIRQYLDEKGSLAKDAPKEVLSVPGLADSLGVGYANVRNAINELGDTLGETQRYKFKTVTGEGYTPEQQELIRQHLERKGLLVQEAPEGILSATGIGKKLGINNTTISKEIAEIGTALGETGRYRFAGVVTDGYTPEQQEQIERHLEAKGLFADKASEGVLSARDFGEHVIGSRPLVYKAISELGDAIGEVKIYRFRTRVAIGYTPEQQVIIKQYIEDNLRKNKNS